MGVFNSYKIDGDNLVLNEHLHWTFEPDRQDAVQEWTLHNFDKSSITTDKLDRLVSYDEDADTEVKQENGRIEIWFYTYFDQSEYTIFCDRLTQTKRPYNAKELTRIILNRLQQSDRDYEMIVQQKKVIDEIKKFIDNQMTKKEIIIKERADDNSKAFAKASGQLDQLRQLKNVIDNFEKEK